MNAYSPAGWPASARIAIAVAMLLSGLAAAGAEPGIGSDLYIGAMSRYQRTAGHSAGFDTFYVTAELNVRPFGKPYHGGLFVDFRDSSSNRLTDNLNVGAYARYDTDRWDSTVWLFSNHSPQQAARWVYSARVRYRLKDHHKLGVEALAPIERADEPVLMGGYYGSISKALSVRLLAGTGVKGGPDFAARMELVWQVH